MPKYRVTYITEKKYETLIEASNVQDAVDAFSATYHDKQLVSTPLQETLVDVDEIEPLT